LRLLWDQQVLFWNRKASSDVSFSCLEVISIFQEKRSMMDSDTAGDRAGFPGFIDMTTSFYN